MDTQMNMGVYPLSTKLNDIRSMYRFAIHITWGRNIGVKRGDLIDFICRFF